jgi:hypothetical protein
MQPYGGTEIQYDYLIKYASKAYVDSVQITTSVPEKIPLNPIKPNILWLKNSYDQPNLAPWFKDKNNHSKYDWYVFNSHWTYEKFRYFFDIPQKRSVIIKNGIDYDELKTKDNFKFKGPLKLIYMSTPWRGLSVLLKAMEQLDDNEIVLDVYSSTQIYGDNFKAQTDHLYEKLYDKARSLKNVNYKGYCNHKTLVSKLPEYHMNVHPSIWEETFCISAMESLAAGQLLLTTNLGAIYETCAEFPVYVPYAKDENYLADQFVRSIKEMKKVFKEVDLKDKLRFQMDYYKRYYDWQNIGQYWKRFILGVINEHRRNKER